MRQKSANQFLIRLGIVFCCLGIYHHRSFAGDCEQLAANAGYEEASNVQEESSLPLETRVTYVRPLAAKNAYERCLYKQYRQDFSDASTEDKMRNFVAMYSSKDPDDLVSKVRDSLKKIEVEQRIVAEKLRQKEDKKRAIEKPFNEIFYCIEHVPKAQAAIDRENKIAANGGPRNILNLRWASEILVDCSDEEVRRRYIEYRKNGGTQTLSDLGWPIRR